MAGVLRVKVGGEWIDVGVGGSGADEKVPAGSVFSTVAVVAPAGYLILDGTTITGGQSLYPNLWAVIPAAWKSGANIVLPDARGRAIVGAGTGTGLTNRPLASAFGSETHTLTTAQLAAHAHVHNAHAHVHNNHGHAQTGTVSSDHTHAHAGAGAGATTGWQSATHAHGPSGADSFLGLAGGGYWLSGTAGSYNYFPTGSTANANADHYHPLQGNTAGISANHTHTVFDAATSEQNATSTEQNAGGGAAHPIVQPSIALNWIIKT